MDTSPWPSPRPSPEPSPRQRPDGHDAATASGPVAAIVLAAGASTRLGSGRSKQLLRYQGRTLLRHSVEQALASSCRPVIVVLGAEVESCQRELAGLDVHVTINPAWADGMGSSIRAGMTALTAAAPDARAVVITLCDQPLVGAAFIDRLVQRFGPRPRRAARRTGQEPTVAAEYDGRPGVPALFPRSRFAELSRLDGAAGARHLLRATPAQARGARRRRHAAVSRKRRSTSIRSLITRRCPNEGTC